VKVRGRGAGGLREDQMVNLKILLMLRKMELEWWEIVVSWFLGYSD
jgi:hypothetical protein